MTQVKNAARKGFTLIELIVVIVIIGILAAVAAVSYNSFIANADESGAVAAAAQGAKALQADSAFNRTAYEDYTVNGAPNSANWTGDLQNVDFISSATANGITTFTFITGAGVDEDGNLNTTGGYSCTVRFDEDGVGTSPNLQGEAVTVCTERA